MQWTERVENVFDKLRKGKFNDRCLGFCDDYLGHEGVAILAQGLRGKTLQVLRLENNKIGENGIPSLIEVFQSNPKLERISLCRNGVTALGMKLLAKVLCINFTIFELDLSSNPLSDEGVEHLAHALSHNKTLITLKLGSVQVGDKGIKHLVHSLKQSLTLTYLSLWKNQITASGAHDLANLLKFNRSLTSLNLEENKIGAGATVIFQAIPHTCNLIKLNVRECDIGDQEISEISKVLQLNPKLTSLDLGQNNFESKGIEILAQSLIWNHTLQTLNLGNCSKMKENDAHYFVESLKSNKTLSFLSVFNSQMHDILRPSLDRNYQLDEKAAVCLSNPTIQIQSWFRKWYQVCDKSLLNHKMSKLKPPINLVFRPDLIANDIVKHYFLM